MAHPLPRPQAPLLREVVLPKPEAAPGGLLGPALALALRPPHMGGPLELGCGLTPNEVKVMRCCTAVVGMAGSSHLGCSSTEGSEGSEGESEGEEEEESEGGEEEESEGGEESEGEEEEESE